MLAFDPVKSRRRPLPLKAGDPVHIVAPSGPVEATRFERGRARLAHSLSEARFLPSQQLFERSGYFAGDDATRAQALRTVFSEEGGGALWCARGGYGLTRILKKLDAKALMRNPKCIIGFSDVTALLCWAYVAADLCSLHAPVVTQISTLHPHDLEATLEWLRGEVPSPMAAESDAVSVLHGGQVEGPLIAGNLEVLRSLIGTPFMPELSGAVLALEEIGEQPYRIDRALTQLISSGALRGVKGVIVGQLLACDDPKAAPDRPSAVEVCEERLGRLGIPVVLGAPFGHAPDRNFPLPFGVRVRLDADSATLIFLEPLCVDAAQP